MQPDIKVALKNVLDNWNGMQGSQMDEAEEDADRFEASFYDFITEIKHYLLKMDRIPKKLETALKLPTIKRIVKALPTPLYLNFESELDLMIEEINKN